jgi:LEA14-like dessication related protein
MRFLLFILLLVVAASSCRQPRELVYQDIQNFSLKQAGLQKSTLSMVVRLYNPNNYKLRLKKSDIEVFVNGKLLGKMSTDGGVSIARRDTSSLPVMLDVSLGGVLSGLLGAAFNSEVTVKLSGSIKAGRHGIFVRVPVDYESKQDVSSLLKM